MRSGSLYQWITGNSLFNKSYLFYLQAVNEVCIKNSVFTHKDYIGPYDNRVFNNIFHDARYDVTVDDVTVDDVTVDIV